MLAPEVLQGSNGDLKDLNGPDLDVQKLSAPLDASDLPSSKVSGEDSAAAQDSHRRSGRTRTVRVRDGFFDSSLLHYVSLDAAPRDGFPARRSPKPPRRPKAKAGADDSEDDEDWDGTGVGADYQADIPAFRQRPAKPSASEAKFLALKPLYVPVEVAAEVTDDKGKVTKTRAGRAGVTCPMPPVGVAASSADFRYKWRWCKDSAAKRSLLSAAVHALDKQLGDDKAKLCLDGLGFKLRDAWKPQEELLFALGMCDKYRMFKYIRQSYLWRRSTHELNAYYHNVWKTRSTDLADEFLTLREEDATRLEYMAFVDKVRDQIVSIWDKKTMGDMPKVVRDMAAAAAAERAAGPAKVHIKQHSLGRPQVDVYAHTDSDDELSNSSGGTGDSARRAALKRATSKLKKRRYAALSAADAADRLPKRPAGSGGTSGQAMTYGHANGRYRVQGVGRPWELPAPTGSGLEQWLHPGQPKAQKPRTAIQRTPGHAKLDLPEMPQAQLPDPNNKEEVAAWLKRLPDFRRSLQTHLEAVDHMTETAIGDCHRLIKQLEDQRQSREDYAEQYIGILMQHGRSILVKLEDAELQDKLAQRQADALQPEQQQDGQQEQRAVGTLDAPAGQAAASAAAGAAETAVGGAASLAVVADKQQQQQQQQVQPDQKDTEMTLEPAAQPAAANGQQQQQQQGPEQAGLSAQQPGAGQDAVRTAMGPPPARPLRPQLDGSAVDGVKQQEDEPQQQSDTTAGVDVGTGAGELPFPGGPLLGGWGVGQWSSQPLGPAAMPWLKQPINTPGSAAHKPIPRPYMHRTSS